LWGGFLEKKELALLRFPLGKEKERPGGLLWNHKKDILNHRDQRGKKGRMLGGTSLGGKKKPVKGSRTPKRAAQKVPVLGGKPIRADARGAGKEKDQAFSGKWEANVCEKKRRGRPGRGRGW